ncbi:hypothetical protein Peur_008084 [Populus x canadensis]
MILGLTNSPTKQRFVFFEVGLRGAFPHSTNSGMFVCEMRLYFANFPALRFVSLPPLIGKEGQILPAILPEYKRLLLLCFKIQWLRSLEPIAEEGHEEHDEDSQAFQ